MSPQQQQAAARIFVHLRTPDPVLWAIRDAQFQPDPWQARLLWTESKRVSLNCCRQSGKSTTTAHKALHSALYTPDFLALLISPSLRQSAELFRKITQVMAKLPDKPELVEDNKLSLQFKNGSRIVSLPSSEGTIRGFSAVNLVIIDEASRVPDALYHAIRPMLAISDGQLIVMSTPFGRRGFFYEDWERRGNWEQIQITADMCPRISAEFLREEKDTLGEWMHAQEYCGEFVEAIGQYFSAASIEAALSDEVLPLFLDRQDDTEMHQSSFVNPLDDLWQQVVGVKVERHAQVVG